MTDQDPYGDPTRVDVPVTDPTQAMPTTSGGPPTGGQPPYTPGPPGPPGGRGPGQPDRRWWILAGLFALVLLIGLAALLLGGDDAEETSTTDTTSTTSTTLEETTTTSSSATTSSSTTSTSTSTTTTTPPATVAPALCTSGEPDDPDHTAVVLYQAYALDDRGCAEQIATNSAVDTLFAIPGGGSDWEYQGCTEQDEPDPHLDCAFTFPGGATHFRESYSDTDGWVIYEVYQTTD